MAEVCLSDEAGHQDRFRLPDYDGGSWHGFVPGIGPGQAYRFRVRGPYDTARGLRCNPAKPTRPRCALGTAPFGPGAPRPAGFTRAGVTLRAGSGLAAFGFMPQ